MNRSYLLTFTLGLFFLIGYLFLARNGAPPPPPTAEPLTIAPSGIERLPATTVAVTPERNDVADEEPPLPPKRRLRAGELLLAADIDDIPAIMATDSLFVDAQEGTAEWPDTELVLGLQLGDQARAYPVRLLSLHEIVNDTVAGMPVAVTWCPLCFSAMVFDRVIDGREHTFGVSGYLYRSNLVMYDHQTNTLWSQLVAQAIKGAQSGARLQLLPSSMMAWSEWRKLHPDTTILSAAALDRDSNEVIDPYAGYYRSSAAGFETADGGNDQLPPKALVIGINHGSFVKAYPLQAIADRLVVNDTIGDLQLLLSFDEALGNAAVFAVKIPELQGAEFGVPNQAGEAIDDQSASVWDLREGVAISGPLEGQKLERMATTLVFWFAWSGIYPKTELYR